MITILQQSNCLGEFRLLMNESSINYFNHKQIRHVLTVWVTFCKDLTLMLQTVFEQPINPFNDTFASTNSPWNHFFVIFYITKKYEFSHKSFNIIRIVFQTVKRITDELLGGKGLKLWANWVFERIAGDLVLNIDTYLWLSPNGPFVLSSSFID